MCGVVFEDAAAEKRIRTRLAFTAKAPLSALGAVFFVRVGFHSGCYASWAWMRVVVAAARGCLGLRNLQGGVKAAA